MKEKYLGWKVVGAFLAIIPLVFYRAFIAKYFWNWFVVTTLHVSAFSFLQWLGLCWFISLFSGPMTSNTQSEIKRWNLLMSALELCVPEGKQEALKEIEKSWPDPSANKIAIDLLAAVGVYSLILLFGYLLHLLLS
jgi:hypothetical protein